MTRRGHRRTQWLARIGALLVVLVVLTQATLAFAIPCTAVSACADGAGDDRDDDCPCPLPCPGCAHTGANAAIPPAMSTVADVPLAPLTEWTARDREQGPPTVEPAEILHVPRPSHHLP